MRSLLRPVMAKYSPRASPRSPARNQPSGVNAACCFSRIVQITGKERRTAHLQLAFRRQPHFGPGAGPSRARRRHFERIARPRVEPGLQLGHAPELRHRAARQLLGEIPDEGGRRDGPGYDRELERGPVVALERTRAPACRHVGGSRPERRWFQFLDQRTKFVRFESGKEDRAGADRPGAMQRIKAVEVRKRRRAKDPALFTEAVLGRADAAVPEHRPIRVHDALGRSRGAGRIEKEERVFGLGLAFRMDRSRCLDLGERDAAALEHLLRLRHADREARAAVAHQRLNLGAAVRHVQRAGHRAKARDREIAEDELRGVRKLQRHHVARCDPARAQSLPQQEGLAVPHPSKTGRCLARQAPAHPGARARGARASARAYRRPTSRAPGTEPPSLRAASRSILIGWTRR